MNISWMFDWLSECCNAKVLNLFIDKLSIFATFKSEFKWELELVVTDRLKMSDFWIDQNSTTKQLNDRNCHWFLINLMMIEEILIEIFDVL